MHQTSIILENILQLVSTTIDHAKSLHPDVPIQNQFDDFNFDELDYFLALVQYELDFLVEIPDQLAEDYRITFRQLAEAIGYLKPVEDAKAEEFRENKRAMIRQFASQMLEKIERMKKGTNVS